MEAVDGAVGLLMVLPRVIFGDDVNRAARRAHELYLIAAESVARHYWSITHSS